MPKSFDFRNSESELAKLQQLIGATVSRWLLKPGVTIDLETKTILAAAVALKTDRGYLRIESDWFDDTEEYLLAGQKSVISFETTVEFVQEHQLKHSKKDLTMRGSSAPAGIEAGRGRKILKIELFEYYEAVEDEWVRYDGAVAVTTDINETFVLRVNKSILGSLFYCFYEGAYEEVKSKMRLRMTLS